MTPRERVDAALQLASRAHRKLARWEEEPDPVVQRGHVARAASFLRAAADVLDAGRSDRR